jgi:hypothetical protein
MEISLMMKTLQPNTLNLDNYQWLMLVKILMEVNSLLLLSLALGWMESM